MQMVCVMMKTTMKPASLMEEIAVDLMSIQNGAMYVNALKEEEEGVVEELQHLPELQLANWKMDRKFDKQQCLGIILCLFMYLKWLWLLCFFAKML